MFGERADRVGRVLRAAVAAERPEVVPVHLEADARRRKASSTVSQSVVGRRGGEVEEDAKDVELVPFAGDLVQVEDEHRWADTRRGSRRTP